MTMQKFDKFIRLTIDRPLLDFDCGDEDINQFFINDSKAYLEKLLVVTYLLESSDSTVLYFTLSNDKITAIETDNGYWRKIKNLFPHSKHRKDYPAVKIGRFGVNLKYKGHHLGTQVLDYIKHWMITDNKTGCRFITVDAYMKAVPFYIENGFKFMGEAEKKRYEEGKKDTIALYYDLYEL